MICLIDGGLDILILLALWRAWKHHRQHHCKGSE